MLLTFASRHLDRTIALADLPHLSEAELRELHCELTMAIQVMDTRIAEAKDGGSADQNWLNRVNKKRRICQSFADQVQDVIHSISTADRLYLANVERIIAERFGHSEWLSIHKAALDLAAQEAVARQALVQAA